MIRGMKILLPALLAVMSCGEKVPEPTTQDVENSRKKEEISALLGRVGATKTVETFDYTDWPSYTAGNESWCKRATLTKRQLKSNKVEGSGCFVFDYSFTGQTTDPSKPELLYVQRVFDSWRSDFSFSPLGISFWVKGMPSNAGALRLVLLHDDRYALGSQTVRQTYQCTDTFESLKSAEWTRVVFPFDWFEPYNDAAKSVKMDLGKVIGWRLEIVNTKAVASSTNQFMIDCMEQLTSYVPQWNTKARFNSLFVQIHDIADYRNMDWDDFMATGKSVGIDTWFIPYSVGHKEESAVSFFSSCTLPRITKKMDMLDKMVAAAEKAGCKIIFGPDCQYYASNKADKSHYEGMLATNKIVIDDLAAAFGSSPAFGGWYIADEFWDGGWKSDAATEALGWYLENTAVYMKSKKDADVCIAPALWRGFSAKVCGQWFESLFTRTRHGGKQVIDYLYLQDCGGRGPSTWTCVEVDFPNWYGEIKSACERTGVHFGIDLESFMQNARLGIDYRAKTWEEVKLQLQMAGAFTEYITNFSYATFKPGTPAFEGYKEYYNSL